MHVLGQSCMSAAVVQYRAMKQGKTSGVCESQVLPCQANDQKARLEVRCSQPYIDRFRNNFKDKSIPLSQIKLISSQDQLRDEQTKALNEHV